MSETMSSGDIEDVLSSIRRLVSDDLRPASKVEAKPKASLPDTAGKLLLTPALRVVSSLQDSAEAVDQAKTVSASPHVNDDALPEDEAPFICVDEEDFGQVVDFKNDTLLSFARRRAVEPFDERAAFDDPESDGDVDEDWLHETQADPVKTQTNSLNDTADAHDVTRVVNDIAAGFSDNEAEWESETGDSPVVEDLWQVPPWGDTDATDLAVKKAVADLAEDAAVAEILAQANQEKATEPTQEQNENRAPETDVYFEESVLRDLVRDLIREELSGTLGERITRNVRKLVRVEVNRALSERGLD